MTDILVTMHQDLERALAKKPEDRRWAMLIDLRKCVGCHACTIACVSENKLPPKMNYRPVYEYEQGAYPKVVRTFLAKPCMQCDKPTCVDACPVKGEDGATWKEKQGIGAGIVAINYDKCIGCKKCVSACAYESRSMDQGGYHMDGTPAVQKYETMPSFEYGKVRRRTSHMPTKGVARKCHYCIHRLANGMLPQCITTCVGRAGYFGDLNDPQSLLAQVRKANKIQILRDGKDKAGKDTEPRTCYIANVNLRELYGKS
jgi:molybdopterin-containing oxidoreductase family iron-sulfur binding subunit